jgi:uncharacterized PurR-regulated membrane protein YhhQ (DUF165 family)
MKIAALILLAIATLAYILVETNLAIVGPWTTPWGAFCLRAILLCLPCGLLLLGVVALRHMVHHRKSPQIIQLKLR